MTKSPKFAGVLAAVLLLGLTPNVAQAQFRGRGFGAPQATFVTHGFTGDRVVYVNNASVGNRGFAGNRVEYPGRGYGVGTGLVGRYGYGLNVGAGPGRFYVTSGYVYSYPSTVYYNAEPVQENVIYLTNPIKTTTVIIPASAPAPAPATAPALAPVASAQSPAPAPAKIGKLVYDDKGSPTGVLVLREDGSQEFVPLTQ